MAVKDKNEPKKSTVTRISASDTSRREKVTKTASEKTKMSQKPIKAPRRKNPIDFLAKIVGGIAGYFKGAWFELRQVRWPNRRATWGMTGALLGFTAFFVVFILLVDALFEYLFKLMLG